MKYERYKEIMEGLGMPNSTSLLLALKQVANEVHQEYNSEGYNIEEDYKNLEDKFKSILSSTGSFVLEHPHLADDLDDFIVEVGTATKDICQKYGKLNHICQLEVEDYKEQMLAMKHTMVKMKLKMKPIENACQGFVNASKGD